MIAYCTNIHPGESWDETFANIRDHVPIVKAAVSPISPFPVGLRLSGRAADEMDGSTARLFHDWLGENGCFIPTINGFPYGPFHSQGLKENVYLPDWRSPERVRYAKRLATLLGAWLPAGVTGSVSTVPVGFKAHVGREEYPLVRRNLLDVIEHIDRIRQKSGADIILSLEPEPGCLLETADDVVSFFDAMAFPGDLKTSIGICFDLCHQAVEFETPSEFLEILADADIRIGKVQVSSGLSLAPGEVGSLNDFAEQCYLHQVVVRGKEGTLTRYDDIPQALARHTIQDYEEWRAHFHLPIYAERTICCGTTRSFIEEALPLLNPDLLLEIETYTWQVLPSDLQAGSITQSVIREIEWLKARLMSRERGKR